MLSLRLKIIKKILEAAEPSLVKEVIRGLLEEEINEHGQQLHLSQLIHNITSDILFQLMSKQNHQEFKNLSEALEVIQSYKANLTEEEAKYYRR